MVSSAPPPPPLHSDQGAGPRTSPDPARGHSGRCGDGSGEERGLVAAPIGRPEIQSRGFVTSHACRAAERCRRAILTAILDSILRGDLKDDGRCVLKGNVNCYGNVGITFSLVRDG